MTRLSRVPHPFSKPRLRAGVTYRRLRNRQPAHAGAATAEYDHCTGVDVGLDTAEGCQQQLGLLIGVMRRPPEQDDARTRMTTDGQQLPEVRVRRDGGSIVLASCSHHIDVGRAERIQIADVNGIMPGGRRQLRDTARQRLVDEEPHPAAGSGSSRAMESFFALLQRNVVDRRCWRNRDELRIAIVTWIERTYHRRRRQAALGRLTPIDYEMTNTPPATLAA